MAKATCNICGIEKTVHPCNIKSELKDYICAKCRKKIHRTIKPDWGTFRKLNKIAKTAEKLVKKVEL